MRRRCSAGRCQTPETRGGGAKATVLTAGRAPRDRRPAHSAALGTARNQSFHSFQNECHEMNQALLMPRAGSRGGVLRRFWVLLDHKIGFRPLSIHKSETNRFVSKQSRVFWQSRTDYFLCFRVCPGHNYNGNLEYKWTITCDLVVRNTKKGTTLIMVITINVVKSDGVVPRDPHFAKTLSGPGPY
jgi:hypothetical protein